MLQLVALIHYFFWRMEVYKNVEVTMKDSWSTINIKCTECFCWTFSFTFYG